MIVLAGNSFFKKVVVYTFMFYSTWMLLSVQNTCVYVCMLVSSNKSL